MPRIVLWFGILAPLAVDGFAIGAALGLVGLPPRDRLRVSLVMAGFEGLMPIVGFLVGSAGSRFLGQFAGYAAAAFLAVAGAQLLRPGAEEVEERTVRLMTGARGVALLSLGLSVSIDELAIGFSLGLLGIPLAFAVVWIAIQAFVACQLGLNLGARLGEPLREGAEKLAGVALLFVAAVLLYLKISGHG